LPSDWDPNSLAPKPAPPPIANPPPSSPPPGISPPPPKPLLRPREPRLGPLLFAVGLALLSLNFLLDAYVFYSLYNSPSSSLFNSIELAYALGTLFTAIGVLMACAGWLIDKGQTARARGLTSQSAGWERRLAGRLIVTLGASAVAAATLTLSIIELDEYWMVSPNLPIWVLWTIYLVEGLGILGIAIGWGIHRSAFPAVGVPDPGLG